MKIIKIVGTYDEIKNIYHISWETDQTGNSYNYVTFKCSEEYEALLATLVNIQFNQGRR